MQRHLWAWRRSGLLIGSTAGADTVLMHVTPQNIRSGTFQLSSKAARNRTVEFVIRRDVSRVDGPGRSAYLAMPADGKGLGTPVRLEESGGIWTFRLSLRRSGSGRRSSPLWGGGARGEGITYRFQLGQFRKPGPDPPRR